MTFRSCSIVLALLVLGACDESYKPPEPLPDLAAIRVPVLALGSTRSSLTDGARTRSALAALPDCDFVQIDAVHWIPTEQPEAMRTAIEDWLGRKLTALP